MTDWTAGPQAGTVGIGRASALPGARRHEPPGPAAVAGPAAGDRGPAGPTAAGPGAVGRARGALRMTGAALSLSLVAGVGVWGYGLVKRELLGPPVVQAAEGPMRVAPADPGGEVAAHQGLSVNAVAGVGEAAPPSDVLILAPATNGLSDEDVALAQSMAEADEPMPTELIPTEPMPVEPGAPAAGPTAAEAGAETGASAVAAPAPMGDVPLDPAVALAVMEAASVAAPVEGEPAPAATAPADAVVTEAAASGPAPVAALPPAIPAAVPGVAAAVRPPARPAAALAAAQGVEATAAEVIAPAPVVAFATAVPAGTSLVQLGAFGSLDLAAAEWDRLSGTFAEFLEGKERIIQQAESGGQAFFRLRAMGFADHADARRFCAALVAEDAGCVPVVAD